METKLRAMPTKVQWGVESEMGWLFVSTACLLDVNRTVPKFTQTCHM